jgi:hypothetical protein
MTGTFVVIAPVIAKAHLSFAPCRVNVIIAWALAHSRAARVSVIRGAESTKSLSRLLSIAVRLLLLPRCNRVAPSQSNHSIQGILPFCESQSAPSGHDLVYRVAHFIPAWQIVV